MKLRDVLLTLVALAALVGLAVSPISPNPIRVPTKLTLGIDLNRSELIFWGEKLVVEIAEEIEVAKSNRLKHEAEIATVAAAREEVAQQAAKWAGRQTTAATALDMSTGPTIVLAANIQKSRDEVAADAANFRRKADRRAAMVKRLDEALPRLRQTLLQLDKEVVIATDRLDEARLALTEAVLLRDIQHVNDRLADLTKTVRGLSGQSKSGLLETLGLADELEAVTAYDR